MSTDLQARIIAILFAAAALGFLAVIAQDVWAGHSAAVSVVAPDAGLMVR